MDKIKYDDFKKVEIKVGKILKVEKIEKSEKLLKLSVDFKEETGSRQIISGIAPYFPNIEDLINKKCLFATNLEVRSLMGLDSNGMVLAVNTPGGVFSLCEVGSDDLVGSLVG
jgi:methionyl-tRNA synthetase